MSQNTHHSFSQENTIQSFIVADRNGDMQVNQCEFSALAEFPNQDSMLISFTLDSPSVISGMKMQINNWDN